MVWIYDGYFVTGSSTEPMYNGNNLAKQENVIVVTLNYRLGILGFLSSDELATEDPSWGTSGNYGLLDQNLALKWIKGNIGNFGGDSNRMNIFGKSAGAFSICFHM